MENIHNLNWNIHSYDKDIEKELNNTINTEISKVFNQFNLIKNINDDKFINIYATILLNIDEKIESSYLITKDIINNIEKFIINEMN
jgi:hypothetical protein